MFEQRFLVPLFACLLLLGCPSEEKFDPSEHPPSPIEMEGEAKVESPAEEPADEALEGSEVRLLNPGEEPREELRYRVPEGFEGAIDMVIAMAMRQPQPLEMPPIRLRMNVSDVKVDPEGFAYSFTFDDPTVDGELEDMPPERKEEFLREISQLGMLRGKVSLDNRGMLRDVSFDEPGQSPQLDQLVTEIEQSVRAITTALPEEPVGVGAAWEVVQTHTTNELTLEQRAEMTLRERDGSRLVIGTDVTQSAGRQRLPNPRLPPEAAMYLESMKGSGGGVANVDLASLLPHARTTSSSSTEAIMEIQMNDQRQVVQMVMDLDLTLKGAGDED